MFITLWTNLHSLFNRIILAMSQVVMFVNTPIMNLTVFNLPTWLNRLFTYVLGFTNIGSYTVLDLMLGVGLPMFIGLAVMKYFTDVIRG